MVKSLKIDGNVENILRYGEGAFEKIYRNREECEVSLRYSESIGLTPLQKHQNLVGSGVGRSSKNTFDFEPGFFWGGVPRF